jgi:hypothetical protein
MGRPKKPEVLVEKPPKLKPEQAVVRLAELRDRILKAVAAGRLTEDETESLRYDAEGVLEDALGEGNDGIQRVLHAGANQIVDVEGTDYEAEYAKDWKLRAGHLDKLIERIKSNIVAAPPAPAAAPTAVKPTPLQRVEHLVKRFHRVALQLRKRHGGRAAHTVADEYDVQDLLHALLKLEFDDIRPEEWTGSYAGKASRMDFLLKAEQLVIEVKMTRDSLGTKEVGDELIIDIGRYRAHADCKTLVCFVYDPSHHIDNPDGLEHDLSGSRDGLEVRVFIAPKS